MIIFWKADSMDIKIGYPDWLYNDTYLDEIYKSVILKLNFLTF